MQTDWNWRPRFFRDYIRTFRLAKGQTTDLIMILTHLTSDKDHSQPDLEGTLRLEKGVEWARAFPNAGLAILGYYPDIEGKLLSKKYEEWLRKEHLDLAQQLDLVGGIGNNTIMDIMSEGGELQRLLPPQGRPTIAIPTDWNHFRRTAPTLYSLGYRAVWLPIQSSYQRDPRKELLGFLWSLWDPRWITKRSRTTLTEFANKNARTYQEGTR